MTNTPNENEPKPESEAPSPNSSDSNLFPELSEFSTFSASDLSSPHAALLRTVQQCCLMYDFDQAAQLLESIPLDKRDQAVILRLQGVQATLQEIAGLTAQIDQARRSGDEAEIFHQTRRLMKLKPNEPIVRQILKQYGTLDDKGRYHLPPEPQEFNPVGDDAPRMLLWMIVTGVTAFTLASLLIGYLLRAPRQSLQIRVPEALAGEKVSVQIAGRNYPAGQDAPEIRLPPGEYEYTTRRGDQAVKSGRLLIDRNATTPPEVDFDPQPWSLQFDGPRSYVSIPDLHLDWSRPFTWECWCVPQEMAGCRLFAPVNGSDFAIGLSSAGAWEVLYRRSTGPQTLKWGSYEPGCRIHLACVATATELNLFVNGILIGHAVTGARVSAPAQDYLLGTSATVQGAQFMGTIEQLRVEAGDRYRSRFVPPTISESGERTALLYRMTEHRRDLLVDFSGHGHHGRQIGTTWIPQKSRALSVPID